MGDKSQESSKESSLPLKEEFQRSKFSLDFKDPGIFCRSQWQRGDRSIIWIVYRWFLAAFFGTGVIWSMIKIFNGGRWFIYLTDWGFSLDFFTCTYGAVVATIYYTKPSIFGKNENHELLIVICWKWFYFSAPNSRALKVYWISHYTTCVLSMLISLVFWAALASSKCF